MTEEGTGHRLLGGGWRGAGENGDLRHIIELTETVLHLKMKKL